MHVALGIGMAAWLLLGLACGGDDSGLKNPDFEEGQVGAAPAEWILTTKGGAATISADNPQHGKQCVRIGPGEKAENAPLYQVFLQQVRAAAYRGKMIRLKASVRIDSAGPIDQAQLWLRVDRAGGRTGFFDNMADRPIRDKAWKEYEIVGDVARDAEMIVVGIMVRGAAPAWIDDVSLTAEGDVPETISEEPRPLEGRGLQNLVAFTRLLGYVQHFHPSDQAAEADWENLAVEGVRAVERAGNPEELARRLQEFVTPVAPTVRVFVAGMAPPVPEEVAVRPKGDGIQISAWKHVGYGGALRVMPGMSPYRSERVRVNLDAEQSQSATPEPAKPYYADLGGGVSCLVPVAVYANGEGTLPKVKMPEKPVRPPQLSAEDRATRLAAVVLAWNILQHFYPYFDVVQTDWPGALREALATAAVDADETAFLHTLRLLIADLHDGHGRVNIANAPGAAHASLPLLWDWVQGRLVITRVAEDVPSEVKKKLKPGTIALAIDGRPAAEALAAAEREVSGATEQWRRYRALSELSIGREIRDVSLEIEDGDGRVSTIRVPRAPRSDAVEEPRPAKIHEVEPGIFYVDVSRINDRDFTAALERLEKAKGIVFDFRGYPSRLNPNTFFQHLIDHKVTSAQWHFPAITRPDRTDLIFHRRGEWEIEPKGPYLKAKRAFITDGRAISYAESCMGIVEHEKLGAIVGGPTAGTNGNVNPIALPGGYRFTWTGMKVLKHDGTRHHGIGIQPTVPVSRTIAGIARGDDELLQKAVEVVKGDRKNDRHDARQAPNATGN